MTSRIRTLLAERGLTLQVSTPRGGSYTPVREVGGLAYTAGQLPFVDGEIPWQGRVGAELTIAQAQDATVQAFLNGLSALEGHFGTLDRVDNILQLRGYVRGAAGFESQHIVLNPLSDLVGELFEGQPRHVRTAMGVADLPCGAPVELEIVVEVADG